MALSAVRLIVIANITTHPWRFIASAVATALAASVLLTAMIGRHAVQDQAPRAAQSLLPPDELHLAATDTVFPYLDEGLLDAMRADPRVSRLTTAMTVRAVDMPGLESGKLDRESFYSLGPTGMGGWIAGRRDSFLAWEAGGPRGSLIAGEWPSSESVDPIEIAVPKVYWGQTIDSWRRLESDAGVHRAHVVGLLQANGAMVVTSQGQRLVVRQISRAAAEKLAGGPRPPSDARLVLLHPKDKSAFIHDWRARLTSYPGRLELWDDEAINQAAIVSPTAESAKLAVQSAVMLVSACVVCIAFSVQGNAVRERSAQYALLSSLGANRINLATIVVSEAVVHAAAGLIGAVALVETAMIGLITFLPMLRAPAAPDPLSVAVTGLVTMLGVVAGSAWPAFVATRVKPGEDATSATDTRRSSTAARSAAAAGALVAVIVTVVVSSTPSDSLTRAAVLTWVGVPGLAIAVLLFTPAIIRLVSRLFVSPVASLTGTDSLVLADQVTGDEARSTGSVVAVAVGLGGFFWMMCWGASMLDSFIIDRDMPRWLVSVHPYGLNRTETERLLANPRFKHYHPLTLVDTHLSTDGKTTDDGPAHDVPTLIMGVDTQRALGEGPDALPFHFLEGSRADAIAALSTGDACLVSDWYAKSHRAGVGDTISLAAPASDGRTVRTYPVAGVVELRGWRMMTKQNKVRLLGDKHELMVVLNAETTRKDFPVAYTNYLLGDPAPNANGDTPGYRGDLPEDAAHEASAAEREEVEAAAEAAVDLSQPVDHSPYGLTSVRVEKRVFQVDDLDRTRNALLGEWGGGAVKRMGAIPLLVLTLSLLSVSGTLVVSLRSRSRELGVLRSCGLTQAGVARLCLAEGLLLGITAIPVAALLGGVGAWIMLEVASIVGWRLDFAGIQPSFIVPWAWLWPGVVTTAAVCCIASVWAAVRIARIPPALLMSGATSRE